MTDSFSELIRAATDADGQPPFSDQSLVDLSTGARRLLTVGDPEPLGGAALVTTGDGTAEAELVVHPDARHRGLGERLLLDVIGNAGGQILIWAHGDHPDARALAAKHGLEPVRQLLQLRAGVVVAPPSPMRGDASRPSVGSERATGVPSADKRVRAFRPGVDDAAWLELNARAFAEHPEQGTLTQPDLDARIAQDWFDADDFLLLTDADGALTGFCWLKVEDAIGEFYAVGVDPEHQGEGLGRTLVAAGLQRLAERGIREASLYVEADNEAAVRLYRSFGFTDYAIDIQYRLDSARSGG